MSVPIFDLDFTGDTPEVVDSGGRPGPGEYLCELTDVFADKKEETTAVLEYTIVDGWVGGKDGHGTAGFNGQKVFDRLRHPSAIDDERAAKFAGNRMKMMAQRLGVWDGTQGSCSLDFTKALGKRFAIILAERKGDKGTFVDITYDGVFPLDHRKCPARWAVKAAAVGGANGMPAAAPAVATLAASVAVPTAAARPAANDFSDL